MKSLFKVFLFVIVLCFSFVSFGQFSTSKSVFIESHDYPKDIIILDIDKDGEDEILCLSESDQKLSYHKNKSDYTFEEVNISIDIEYPKHMDTIDMDYDNDVDVLIYSNSDIYWLENDGKGVFTNHYIGDPETIEQVIVYDLDQDQDYDVIYLLNSTAVSWIENLGGNMFSADNVDNFHSTGAFFTTGFDISDVDGDGDPDLVIHDGNTRAYWHENLGGASFDDENLLYQGGPQSELSDIKLLDLDNDLDKDILVTDKGGSELFYLENLGNGEFSDSIFIWVNDDPYEIIVDDVNEDGLLDFLIISGVPFSYKATYYENLGDFDFTITKLYSHYYPITSAAFGDMDFDNDKDLVVSVGRSDIVSYVLNERTITGIHEDKLILTPFPNPVIENLEIDYKGKYQIFSSSMEVDNGFTKSGNINVSQLERGMYILVTSKNKYKFLKL